jgi:AraC-like DNA-binding protein
MNLVYIGKHLKMHHVKNHRHKYGELVYCTAGTGSFLSAQGRTIYRAGEAAFIPPDMEHRNDSEEGFSNIYLMAYDLPLRSGYIHVIRDSENRDMEQILNQLHYYFNSNREAVKDVVLNLSRLLDSYLSLFAGVARYSAEVERIIRVMVEQFGNCSFNAAEALKKVPMSAEYARKLFTKECGISPARYLQNLRLEHAYLMLNVRHKYRLSVSQIADACGFTDPLYFSRVFHKRMGCAPMQWAAGENA